MPDPANPPTASLSLPVVREVAFDRPLQWLALAWRDMARCGWLSFAHGAAMAVFGAVLYYLARDRFWLLAGAFSGFLVIAPVLATSLYAMSRALEKGEPVNVRLLVVTWTRWQQSRRDLPASYWSLVRFGLLLAAAGTGWVLTSAALITLLAPQPIHGPMDFIRFVVLDPRSYLFELWLAMGGIMAAPMFASSVVSMPLLLDRRATILQAVLTSWQTVLINPMPMALWAALIMGFTLLGLGSLLIGLIFVIPMLGHASWHAYRDLVDPSSLVERLPPKEAP
ncbi:MAG: DUF2189 domain-containing protein [Burkholderiaceae bacterium]